KGGRLHPAVHHLRPFFRDGNLPNLVQRDAGIGWKLEAGIVWRRPGFSKVVSGSERCAEVKALCSRPDALSAIAAVIGHRVDRMPPKLGRGSLPFRPGEIR